MALLNDIVEKLNKQLKENSLGITQCHELRKNLKERKASIENSMSLVSTEFPSKVSEVVQEVNAVTVQINKMTKSFEELSGDIKEHLSKTDATTDKIKEYINDIDELEKCVSYLSWIKAIEDICVEMETSYLEKNEQSLLLGYKRLCNYHKCLQSSSCHNLLSYVNDTVHFWHNLLEETYSREFEEVLKILKWPFVGGNIGLESPPVESLNRFQRLAELLLQLHIPEKSEDVNSTVSSALLTEFALPPLPVRLLLRPLSKRFTYHFRGPRKTNRLDRPEWYLTQILTWIKDHSHFLSQWLQPALDKMEDGYFNVNVEFTRGLVRIVAEKVQADLAVLLISQSSETHVDTPPSSGSTSETSSPSKASVTLPNAPSSPSGTPSSGIGSNRMGISEELFSHLIDEVLAFEKELRDLEYPDAQPGLLSVLTQANVFVWWIHVEKKNAGEKMDQILCSEAAWTPLGSKELDEMKVTECGDNFLSLLLTITERYKNLPQPGHRLQFLDLQLFLLEDFRVRVMQQLHEARLDPFGQRLPSILNTLAYISFVLRDWSDTPHFLQLQFYMMQFDKLQSYHEKKMHESQEKSFINGILEEEDDQNKCKVIHNLSKDMDDSEDMGWTVFDQTLDLFSHLQNDLLGDICDAIMSDIKDKSRPYRNDKWFAMSSPKELLKPSVSPTACPMFEALSEHLQWLTDVLSAYLFTQAWQLLCSDLNQFLYHKLILSNKFNEGGALQLQFDMTRNLFPLFSQFTGKPENHFKEIKEVCFLLTISKGSALLLREALDFPVRQGSSSEEDDDITSVKEAPLRGAARVLAEMGVHKLTPNDAKKILSLRTDLLSI